MAKLPLQKRHFLTIALSHEYFVLATLFCLVTRSPSQMADEMHLGVLLSVCVCVCVCVGE